MPVSYTHLFNGDNGTINYDQDVNGIMVGVDTKLDGNNAKWIVGAAAGFAKGDMLYLIHI